MTQATILVADQEAENMRRLERILKTAGYIPISVSGSKEALETISRFQPDLCFLNPEMPGLDPFKLKTRIAQKRTMPPIVLTLASKLPSSRRQHFLAQYGASGVVSAPFSAPEVILAIENLVGKRHQPLIQDAKSSESFSDVDVTLSDPALSTTLSANDATQDDSDSFNTLSELLNEVSGSNLDLTDLSDSFQMPSKPFGESKKFTADHNPPIRTQDTHPSSTVRVSSDEVQREMARIRETIEKPPKKSRARRPKLTPENLPEKPKIRFSHGNEKHAIKATNGALTSSDIFGALIQDIESGKVSHDDQSAEPQPKKPANAPPPKEDVVQLPEPMLEERKPLGPFATQPIPLLDHLEPDATEPPPKKPDVNPKEEKTPTTGNQYQLLKKIASGGMAEVWKSKLIGEKGFEKIVAIKNILPHLSDNEEFITMFIDEAKVAANLTHPNIAQIYELGKMGDSFFIAMEYVGGYNIRQILNFCKGMNITLAPEIAVFIGMKLCNALNYAHLKKGYDNSPLNIVHRDVSPQNILISTEGEIKLVDFGIAKASNKASQTIAGSLKGKLLYMSPEQADGKPTDARSDTFSLTSVLYEALTGRKLFAGDSELSVLRNVRQAKFTPPCEINPNIPPLLEGILLKNLNKSASDRYESAKELEKAFKFFLKQEKLHLNESDVADYLKWIIDKDVDKLRGFGHHSQPVPIMSPPKPAARPAKPAKQAPASPAKSSVTAKILWWGLGLAGLAGLIWFIQGFFLK